ncbi:MAG: Flp pilus assembly protein CpaB [Rickettsiales bacterium]
MGKSRPSFIAAFFGHTLRITFHMRFGGLIAAIVFAAIAAVIVLRMSAGTSNNAPVGQPVQQPQAAPLKTVNVFVAAQNIPIGTSLTQDMVAIQPWPEHLVLPGFIRAEGGVGAVVGMVARTPFQPQEPIISTKLANRDDPNFLAGMLPKGLRVITIQTNEIEGIAGFVFPGDHVDVMLTHDVDKMVVDPGVNGVVPPPRTERETVTESLLNNVKVLAVDQRATGAATTDPNGKPVVPRSISLMVSPTDAQRLRLAAQKGTLTLALRSLGDRESSDPLTITTPKDITQFPDPSAGLGQVDNSTVTVVRGVNSAVAPRSGGTNGIAPNNVPTPAPAGGGATSKPVAPTL